MCDTMTHRAAGGSTRRAMIEESLAEQSRSAGLSIFATSVRRSFAQQIVGFLRIRSRALRGQKNVGAGQIGMLASYPPIRQNKACR
jgi:hypothetical protein